MMSEICECAFHCSLGHIFHTSVYRNDAGITHVRRVVSVMFLVPAPSCQPSEVNLCAGHVSFRTCSCIHLDPISPRSVQSQWRYRHHYNRNDSEFGL
jgi:hypothetical protein